MVPLEKKVGRKIPDSKIGKDIKFPNQNFDEPVFMEKNIENMINEESVSTYSKIRRVKVIVPAFLILVILAVFAYQAVTLAQFSNQVVNDHATLTQVVNFLNQSIQQAQQKAVQKS